MYRLLLLTFVFICVTGPAGAQHMGSSNRNAPRLEETIRFEDGGKLQIEFVAITWAAGKMMDAAMDEGGEGARQRINGQAERSPLGRLKTSDKFEIGGKTVKKGKYKLFFTIDEHREWHLVLLDEDDDEQRYDWTLALKTSDKKRARLNLDLTAGLQDASGVLEIAFGSMFCAIDLSPAGDD